MDVKDPNIYLAAERTFLSWIRTGLSMMGFGFVVARFGLFLRELSAVNIAHPQNQTGLSTRFGISLVLLGVLVNAASAIRYVYLIRRLRKGDPLNRPSRLAIAVAVVLSIVGGAVVYYLLTI
jgi:inner membrane protein YidH